MELTDDESEANVVVFNTCSIRDKAEHKLYSALGPSAKRKARGENVAIIVAGRLRGVDRRWRGVF